MKKRLLAATAAAALLVAGCGGDDDTTDTTGPAGADTGSSEAPVGSEAPTDTMAEPAATEAP